MINLTKRISITELVKKLELPNRRAVQKWLRLRNIPFEKEGRDNYVNRWLVELEVFIDFAKDLKKKYPNQWPNIFESQIEDKNIVKAVYEIIPPNPRVLKIKTNNNNIQFFK